MYRGNPNETTRIKKQALSLAMIVHTKIVNVEGLFVGWLGCSTTGVMKRQLGNRRLLNP